MCALLDVLYSRLGVSGSRYIQSADPRRALMASMPKAEMEQAAQQSDLLHVRVNFGRPDLLHVRVLFGFFGLIQLVVPANSYPRDVTNLCPWTLLRVHPDLYIADHRLSKYETGDSKLI